MKIFFSQKRLYVCTACCLFSCVLQADYTVTNADDSGAGSLRQAIIDANNNPGNNVVSDAIRSITISSAFPTFIQTYTIDDPVSPKMTINGDGNGYYFIDPGYTISLYSALTGLLQKNNGGTLRYGGNASGLGEQVNCTEGSFFLVGDGSLPTYPFSIYVQNGTFDISQMNGSGISTPQFWAPDYYTPTINLGNKTITLTNDDGSGNDYFGVVTGDGGGFVKEGGGRQGFLGTNSWTGTTTINGGQFWATLNGCSLVVGPSGAFIANGDSTIRELQDGVGGGGYLNMQNPNTAQLYSLNIATTSDSSFSGNIYNSLSITKRGSNKLTLSGSGSNNSAWTISEGTVALSGSGVLGSSDCVVTISGGAFFDIQGTSAGTTIGSLSDSITTGTVELGNKTLTIAGSSNTRFSGVINGSGNMVRQGSGTITLAGTNTFTGTTTLTNGILAVESLSSLSSSSQIIMNGGYLGLASNGLVFNLPLTYNTDCKISALENSSLASAVTGGIGLIKVGAADLTLTNAGNNYSGTTTVLSGTLFIDALDKLGSTSGIVLNSGGLGITSPLTFTPTIDLAGAGSIIANADVTVSSIISDIGSLIKLGSSKLTLTNTNNYSGTTTITTGTLTLSGSGSIDSTSALYVNGGCLFDITGVTSGATVGLLGDGASGGVVDLGVKTLTIGGTGSSLFSGVIQSTGGAGNLVKQGTSTITLAGTNTFTGLTTISDGTLNISSANSLSGTSSISLGAGTLGLISTMTFAKDITLTADAATISTTGGDSTISSAITGGFLLTKMGANNLTLTSASNSYSGGTMIAEGKVMLSGSGILAAEGTVSISSGATFDISGIAGASSTIGLL